MLLVLTHRGDSTADYLCNRLAKAEISYLRLDSETITEEIQLDYRSNRVEMHIKGRSYQPDSFDNLWFRRPGRLLATVGRDEAEKNNIVAEWSEALEGFIAHIPAQKWMNHPAFNVQASHKLEQLSRAEHMGLKIPKTLVTQFPHALQQFWDECQGRLIVKPLASGFLERSSIDKDTQIYTNRVSREHLTNGDLQNCPSFFQELVHKTSDVRVTIVDNDIHAVALKSVDATGTQQVDIRRNNMNGVAYEKIVLPGEIAQILLRYVRSYQLRFAAIDMAIDRSGDWVFFENNPNGQWAWLDLVGISDIASSFIKAFRP